jgi:hypothetical protein
MIVPSPKTTRVARSGFHFSKYCFVERHEYLSERFRLWLVLTNIRLELWVMVNERLDQNSGSYCISRRLHRRAPYRELNAKRF